MPQSPVTQILVQIAQEIAKLSNCSTLEILMPGIAYETDDENYKDLREIDIQTVLTTHHAKGKFLIPVKLLKTYVTNPNSNLYCPYYLYTSGEYEYLELSREDIEHLFMHSKETNDLRIYLEEAKEPNSLYKELSILGQRLKSNDTSSGKGTELEAGGGAYSPSEEFISYFTNLESCYFLRITEEPNVSMLPEACNLAYALYDGNLYFINRFDATNPVQMVADKNLPSRFPVHLVSAEESLSIATFSTQFHERPLIVKHNNQFYLLDQRNTPIFLAQKEILPIYKSFPEKINKVLPVDLEGISKKVYDELFAKGYQSTPFVKTLENKFTENQLLNLGDLFEIEMQTDHCFLSGILSVPEAIRKIILDIRNFLIHPYLAYKISDYRYGTNRTIHVESNIKTCIATLGEALPPYVRIVVTPNIE